MYAFDSILGVCANIFNVEDLRKSILCYLALMVDLDNQGQTHVFELLLFLRSAIIATYFISDFSSSLTSTMLKSILKSSL